MKAQEFLKKEKDHYGKIFVDINYAVDNVEPFISNEELACRKYVSRLPVLKKYIEAIEAAERDIGKGGFLSSFGNDKYTDLLEDYKKQNREELNQLEKCCSCACLNCTKECKFDSCNGCREGSKVVYCDHEGVNAVFYDNFMLELVNERTGKNEKYIVLATVDSIERDHKYIIIEGLYSKEKYILYYYPGISEDTYGEITNEEEFEFVVSIYESIER